MKRLILPGLLALTLGAVFGAGYLSALYEVYHDCGMVGVAEVMPRDEYIGCEILEDSTEVETGAIENGPAEYQAARFDGVT